LTCFSLHKTSKADGITTDVPMPQETTEEATGYFNFNIGVELELHPFNTLRFFNAIENTKSALTIDAERYGLIKLDGSFRKGRFGVYGKYNTEISNPTASLNYGSTVNTRDTYDNLNLGSFYMYHENAGVFFETDVKNMLFDLKPKINLNYHNKTLTPEQKYGFSSSSEQQRVGISNYSYWRSDQYKDITVGFAKDDIKLPLYDYVNQSIYDAKYSGYGIFFRYNVGNKTSKLNSPFFSLISTSTEFSSSLGDLDVTGENKGVIHTTFKSKQEFYIANGLSLSYIAGTDALLKRNTWSDISIAVGGVVSGVFGYALLSDPSSIKYEGYTGEIIPFKSIALQFLSSVVSTVFIQEIVYNKLFNYNDNGYIANTYYGVSLRFEY